MKPRKMNSFKNTKAWSWLDKNILRNWGVPILLHWLHILNNEKQNRYFKPSRSKFCLEAYGNMTVLLPKSVKPNQGVLYKITFFLITYAIFSKMIMSFLLSVCCQNGVFISGLKSNKTFDTKRKSAIFVSNCLYKKKKTKIFRNMKLFEVLPAYSIVF